jgi:hypothetical protein
VVGQGQQRAVEAVVELLGQGALGARPQQIRAADPTGEQGVTGQDEPGLGGPAAVGDDDRHPVRGVTRRVQERHPDVAHLVLLAVGDADVWERDRGGFVDEDRGAGDRGQPPGAGEVVGLDVGLDDVAHTHGLLAGGLEVGLDLQLWIHHSARSGAASAEEVAGAAGLGGEELSEDHGSPPGEDARRCPCVTPVARIGSNT